MTEKKVEMTESKLVEKELFEEIKEQDLTAEAGGAWWNISKNLGNQGKICTLTKECQANCN